MMTQNRDPQNHVKKSLSECPELSLTGQGLCVLEGGVEHSKENFTIYEGENSGKSPWCSDSTIPGIIQANLGQ
jgi:hypothetical protein